jgi:hypothetical protein
MKGRKRADPQAKVLRGTFRADRDRPRARAREGSELPMAAPPDLSDRAAALFEELAGLMSEAGTLSPTYRRVLAHLARLEERAEVMRRSIGSRFVLRTAPPPKDDEGRPRGKRGFLRNPALGQLAELEAQIARLYQMLGLTPDSVLRAPKVGTDDEEDNEFAEFAGS